MAAPTDKIHIGDDFVTSFHRDHIRIPLSYEKVWTQPNTVMTAIRQHNEKRAVVENKNNVRMLTPFHPTIIISQEFQDILALPIPIAPAWDWIQLTIQCFI